jgi:hypothetical protein
MTWRITALGAMVSLATAPPLCGQTTDASKQTATQIVDEMVKLADANARIPGFRDPYSGLLARGDQGQVMSYLILVVSMKSAERKAYRALLDQMEARSDKQLGASPDPKQSTSIALKGTTAEILGLGVETGALAQDIDGAKLTFRPRPLGIVRALQGQGLLDLYRDYERSSAFDFASRWSLGFTFDTSRGSAPGSLTASGEQLSEWSVRYEILNDRRPGSLTYQALFADVAGRGQLYEEARKALVAALPSWPEYESWRVAAVNRVQTEVEGPWRTDRDVAAASVRFKNVLDAELPKLQALGALPAPVLAALDGYVTQLGTVVKAIADIYDFAAKGSLATVDWATTRDPALPDLYAITGVFETARGVTRQHELTANAVLSFYRSTPANSSRKFKSFALTGQYDRPLGTIRDTALVLTLAGRYEYLPKDIPVSARPPTGDTPGTGEGPPDNGAASVVGVAPKGHLATLQAKVTFPVKGGMKIPISVTVANRSELIKEKDVRANVGITLDADSLMALAFGR